MRLAPTMVLRHRESVVETGQMSSVETGQMSTVFQENDFGAQEDPTGASIGNRGPILEPKSGPKRCSV